MRENSAFSKEFFMLKRASKRKAKENRSSTHGALSKERYVA